MQASLPSSKGIKEKNYKQKNLTHSVVSDNEMTMNRFPLRLTMNMFHLFIFESKHKHYDWRSMSTIQNIL